MERSRSSFFRNLPLLAGARKAELDPVVAAAERRDYAKGQPVFSAGEPANHLYWVASGMVRVALPSGRGKELVLHLHGKGQLFGESAAISPGVLRNVDAIAHEAAVCWTVPCGAIDPLLAAGPYALRLARLVDERRRRLERRLALLQHEAVARVAGVLLELAEEGGVRDSRGVILGIKLTHREIAALVGATRETVSFTLGDLRRAGLIEIEERRLVLLDEAGLRALANPVRGE